MPFVNRFVASKYNQIASPTLPSMALSFIAASSMSLTMSNANWGAYTRAKWAISFWYKRASTGSMRVFVKGDNSLTNDEIKLSFNSDQLDILTYKDNTGTANGRLLTTATFTDTTAYHHVLFWFDSANATAGDRMRLWHDGTEITLFSVDTNPNGATQTGTGNAAIGSNGAGAPSSFFDGLLYQLSFFSNALPDISTLYNAGHPLAVTGLTGLYSTLDVSGGDVTHDGVLATAWTNNNSVASSSTIPT